jgi:uncharacterized protein (DUF2252 family)
MNHQAELNEALQHLRECQAIAQESVTTFNDLVAQWKELTERSNAAKAEMQQRIQEMNKASDRVKKLERAQKTRSNLTAGIQFNRKTGTP